MSRRWPAAVLTALFAAGPSAASRQIPASGPPRPAVPIDVVSAIVTAFQSHSLVAFPGPFDPVLRQLFAQPEFAAAVGDLVVGFGNARYQPLMDRFQRGEPVSDDELRRSWLDATDPTAVWESDRYEAFLRMVRDINRTRPADRRMRVLLGDPPIDWSNVRTPGDYDAWRRQRDSYPADLIQREVIAKQRRALLLFSPEHYERRNTRANYAADGPDATLVSRLERATGRSVFTMWPSGRYFALQQDALMWTGGVAMLRGTILGAADFSFYAAPERDVFVERNGRIDVTMPPRGPGWRALRMEDQFDALLVRNEELPVPAPPTEVLCAEFKIVLARMALAGLPSGESQRLTSFCSPLPRMLQAVSPTVRRADVLAAVPLSSGGELQLVLGTDGPPDQAAGEVQHVRDPWRPHDVLAVVIAGAGDRRSILASYQHDDDGCCEVRILEMTRAQIVLMAGNEHGGGNNIHLFFDETTRQVTRKDVPPFSFQRLQGLATASEFAFDNYQQVVRVRPAAIVPYLEIVGTPRPVTEQDRMPVEPSAPPDIPGFTLPQSPGFPPRAGGELNERIGPTAREGSRVWFGKTFDGAAGVGGFGYFDTATKRSELFSPPEIRESAVFSMKVEPDTIWLGLVAHGDMGPSPRGLLRVRRPGMQADVLAVDGGVIHEIVRSGSRLYLATEGGITILLPDGAMEPWFIHVDRDGRPELSRLFTPAVRGR